MPKLNTIYLSINLVIISCFSFDVYSIEYTTNFMWINDKISDSTPYIFPETRFKKNYSKNWDIKIEKWLSAWLEGNPQGKFVFWYQGDNVTEEQKTTTEKLFESLKKDKLTNGTLILKDVRDLKVFKDNKNIFSDPRLTYLKADILRLSAGIEEVEKCDDNICAFVYADIDKGFKIENDSLVPLELSKNNLFHSTNLYYNKTTTPIEKLKKFSLIMRSGPENSFFIMSNHNKNTLKAIQTAVIDSSLIRAKSFIQELDILEKETNIKPLTLDNLIKDSKYENLSNDIRTRLSVLFMSTINNVFQSMTEGPMLTYFNYLEKNLGLLIDLDSLESGGLAKVFSQINLLPRAFPSNVLSNDKFKIYPNHNADLEALIDSASIPTIKIEGSSSTSYSKASFLEP